jgi:hypothetical protein
MFRFSIRDLLWLMLTVALSLAWMSDHMTTRSRLEVVTDERDKLRFSAEAWESSAREFKAQLPPQYNPLDGSILN